MAYSDENIDQRSEVAYGLTDTLVYYAKEDGAPVVMTGMSAFLTILSPSGAVLRARAAATIGSAGKLSQAIAWDTATYPLRQDYIAVWEWGLTGVEYSDRQFFDVVRTKLRCPIDTSDLQELYPDIANHLVSLGETDAKKFIKRAWNRVLDRLRSGHNRPSLILDKVRLAEPTLALAAHFVTDALSREAEDIWSKRSEKWLKTYNTVWAELGELKYDSDEDGTASEEDTRRANRRLFST